MDTMGMLRNNARDPVPISRQNASLKYAVVMATRDIMKTNGEHQVVEFYEFLDLLKRIIFVFSVLYLIIVSQLASLRRPLPLVSKLAKLSSITNLIPFQRPAL